MYWHVGKSCDLHSINATSMSVEFVGKFEPFNKSQISPSTPLVFSRLQSVLRAANKSEMNGAMADRATNILKLTEIENPE